MRLKNLFFLFAPEWFHGTCIDMTERESKNIDKYFCFICKKKDPSLQIVYKKPPAAKRAGGASGKQRQKGSGSAGGKFAESNSSAADKEEEEDYSSLPVFLQPDPSKQCYGLDCTNPARKNSKFCSTTCGYTFYER